VPYKAEAANGTVYFCACKHSKKGALCDGAHKAL
jgi:CDGSH-type Zn-finger protein